MDQFPKPENQNCLQCHHTAAAKPRPPKTFPTKSTVKIREPVRPAETPERDRLDPVTDHSHASYGKTPGNARPPSPGFPEPQVLKE